MKRLVTALLACIILAAPVSAPAVELTFWTTEIHDDRLSVIEFLMNAFMLTQDTITVDVVSVDENDLVSRFEEAQKDGTPPHVIGTGSQLLVALSQSGHLDCSMATDIVRNIGLMRFYPGTLTRFVSTDSRRWCAVPFHGWVQGIWYRADWFEEAGLAPPDNWDALLAAARHFTDPDSGRYGILVGTGEDLYADQVFTQIARSNGAAMFNSQGQVAFNNPAMVEALEYYAKLAACTPKGPQTWRARDYFMQGKLAMLFYSTFIMDDFAIERVAEDSLTAGNFPDLHGAPFDPDMVNKVRMIPAIRHTRMASYGAINGFGISNALTDEEKAAVIQFLEFLYEPANYVTWLHMAPGGMLPVLRDIAASNTFLSDPSGIFHRYGRSKIMHIAEGLSDIDSFGLVNGRFMPASSVVYADGVVPRMISRTVFGGMSAKDSVKQAAEEIKAIAGTTP